MTTQKNYGVFTGTFDDGMEALEDASLSQELINSGVGLYGHGNGIYWMVAHNQMAALMAQWEKSNAPSGVAEFGMSFGYAQGSTTLTNTTGKDIIIQVGTTLTSTNGQTYSVLADPGQPGAERDGVANKNGYVSDDGMGYFIVKAGSSISVDYEANTLGTTANISSTNSITSIDVDGVTTSKSASISNGQSLSDVTRYFTQYPSEPMYYLYQKYGYSPLQGDVNISGDYMTQQDTDTWMKWIDTARNAGVLNIAAITSYNGLNTNYSQPFATSEYWAATRQAALYGGGVAFDMPPSFALNFTQAWYPIFKEAANTYISFIESQIKWADSEGLRSSVIISPQSNDSQAGGLLASTKALVARFKADGVMPSQFIVENYGNVTSDEYQTSNGVNSLQSVSEWLSSQNLTVATNSEAGQEVSGSGAAGYKLDFIMTGIKPTVSVGYNTTTALFDAANAYGASTAATSTNNTVAITLQNAAAGLSLSSNISGVSSSIVNGQQVLTFTGDVSDISKVLQSLKVVDAVNQTADGSANVSITISSTDGSTPVTTNTTLNYGASGHAESSIGSGSATFVESSGTHLVIAENGSLDMSGGASLIADGTYKNFHVSGGGKSTAIAIAVTGEASITDTANTAGVTVNDGGSLTLSNASAFVQVNSGNLYKSGTGALTVNGVITNLSMSNGSMYSNIAMTGTGNIDNASGNIGITLQNYATLETTNSVLYATQDSGTLNTGTGAYVNLTGNGNGYVNANGGVVAYSPSDNNETFHIGNATVKASLNSGYTAIIQDMSSYSESMLSDVDSAHSEIMATNLNSLNDLKIFYGDGNAYLQESAGKGGILIHDVADGGISTFTAMNGQDFSQEYGSNTLMVAVTKSGHQNVITTASQKYTLAGNGQDVQVNGGTGTINLDNTTQTTVSVDMTAAAKVSISGATSNDMTLIMRNMSMSSISRVYADGHTIISNSATGGSVLTLDGNYSLSSAPQTLGGIDISTLEGTHSVVIGLTQN